MAQQTYGEWMRSNPPMPPDLKMILRWLKAIDKLLEGEPTFHSVEAKAKLNRLIKKIK